MPVLSVFASGSRAQCLDGLNPHAASRRTECRQQRDQRHDRGHGQQEWHGAHRSDASLNFSTPPNLTNALAGFPDGESVVLHQAFRLHLEMETHLLVHIGGDAIAPGEDLPMG
jgi:hypothetical protein